MEITVSKPENIGNYQLGAAILLYQEKADPHYYSNSTQAMATVHAVDDVNGRPHVGAGRPLTEGDYRRMMEALGPKESSGFSWNDQKVLAQGLGHMLWWTPPCTRQMFFQKSQARSGGTVEGAGNLPTPGLVWYFSGKELHLFAFKGTARPTQETQLYQAPFFNVWMNGKVCEGTSNRPKGNAMKDPGAWESLFFGSYFTHPNIDGRNGLIRGVHPSLFWEDMLKTPRPAFPSKVLVKLALQVGELLSPDAITKLNALSYSRRR